MTTPPLRAMAAGMELREFAERVLFCRTLEEKLAAPPGGVELTDAHPGPAVEAPAAPGRPKGLQFRGGGGRGGGVRGRAKFPSAAGLEDDGRRAVVYHFLANHELLATELMALVLLKFPAAPPAFRRGVLHTLREEQEHTRLYMRRMEDCGLAFGDLPVNDFFWRCIAPMESPADYVARLSLTFEQANLDYTRRFAGLFREVGDAEGADVFERVYRDEIAHVGYGLKWFRRWKEPGQSDWDAYCGRLALPLSPNRAKAAPFDCEGRERAGLDADFIRRLEVYSRSKGRKPDVYWFNPAAEAEVAAAAAAAGEENATGGGGAPAAVSPAHRLARDLATLPFFLGWPEDVVLLPAEPRLEFLHGLRRAGFELPEGVVFDPGSTTVPAALEGRKLGKLRPWGRSPRSARALAPLAPGLSARSWLGTGRWVDAWACFFSKAWSAQWLRQQLGSGDVKPLGIPLCPPACCGLRAVDVAGAEAAAVEVGGEGASEVVIKPEFGAAGQHRAFAPPGGWGERERRAVGRLLEQSGTVVVECWLDRTFDFSVHYELGGGKLRWKGATQLEVTARGRFRSCIKAPKFAAGVDPEMARFIAGPGRGRGGLLGLYRGPLREALEAELAGADFGGPVSLDAFVYRDGEGSLRLKPVAEINARYTMGRLTLDLARRVAPGRQVRLAIHGRREVARAGHRGFPAFAREMARAEPVVTGAGGKLVAGAVPLNDPEEAVAFLAVLRVG